MFWISICRSLLSNDIQRISRGSLINFDGLSDAVKTRWRLMIWLGTGDSEITFSDSQDNFAVNIIRGRRMVYETATRKTGGVRWSSSLVWIRSRQRRLKISHNSCMMVTYNNWLTTLTHFPASGFWSVPTARLCHNVAARVYAKWICHRSVCSGEEAESD